MVLTSPKKIPKTTRCFKFYLKHNLVNSAYFKPPDKDEIVNIINQFQKGKSLGPNSIPIYILKYNSEILAEPLSKIINLSFEQGIFPDLCKLAKVIPVFKKGDYLECTNYRPISLLSIFSELFEKCVYSRVYSFLEKHKLLYGRQFGFRSGHSTSHALISLVEHIKMQLDSQNFACGIFVDLQKAFDTVDHKILLSKLYFYGFRGNFHQWFQILS